jgi:hypothetical protein
MIEVRIQQRESGSNRPTGSPDDRFGEIGQHLFAKFRTEYCGEALALSARRACTGNQN